MKKPVVLRRSGSQRMRAGAGQTMKKKLIVLIVLVCIVSSRAQAPMDTLIFSHRLHSEVEAGCSVCHAQADSSLQPSDNLLPEMETCCGCHDRETACTLCHSNPDHAGGYARSLRYIARFPHSRHRSEKITCVSCHQGIETKEKSGGRHLPSMESCRQCHQDLEKPDFCCDCHAKVENLRPADHGPDWRKGHGMIQTADKDSCSLCHGVNQCLPCHQQKRLDH